MTQKELMYVDDAINHEENIIAYLTYQSAEVKDEVLSKFLCKEVSVHENLKNELVSLLEGFLNE